MASFNMDVLNMNHILNEYAFYRAVEIANSKKAPGEQPITTSEARRLHEKLIASFAVKDNDGSIILDSRAMSKVNPTDVKSGINNVLASHMPDGEQVFPAGSTLYKTLQNEIAGIFGFNAQLDVKDVVAASQGWVPGNVNGYIPLSPYDTNNMSKYAFVENGARLLYFDRANLVCTGKSRIDYELKPNAKNEVFRLVHTNTNSYMRSVGEYESQDDVTGLSLYAPYISKQDYGKIRAWVNAVARQPGYKVNPAMIQNGVGILRELQHEGIPYKIATDKNEGQLKAIIGGSKLSVRVRDDKEGGSYVGKVYDNGAEVTFTTSKYDAVTKKSALYSPSVHEVVDLLKYYRGIPVEREGTRVGEGLVGSVGTFKQAQGRNQFDKQSAFMAKSKDRPSFTAVYKTLPDNGRTDGGREVYINVASGNKHASAKVFRDNSERTAREQAEEYLRTSVDSARDYFTKLVNIDSLVEQAAVHAGEEDYKPTYAADSTIASLQRVYWDVLTGKDEHLLHLDVTKSEFLSDEALDANVEEDEAVSKLFDALGFGGSSAEDDEYLGTPEEKVRQHMQDAVHEFIGTYEPDAITGLRYDAANVAKYMTGSTSVFRNNDDIIAAMRVLDIPSEELRGDDYFNNSLKDQLIEFDSARAVPMKNMSSEFMQNMFTTIKETIETSGCEVDERDILIDDNGIVKYKAQRVVANGNAKADQAGERVEITGQIGQIFDVEPEFGSVVTKFAGSPNYMFVPGYEASVVANSGPYEGQTLEERTRLKGYEQLMTEQIRATIREDIVAIGRNAAEERGTTTSLNKVYRRVYDTRHDIDFIETARMTDMEKADLDAYEAGTLQLDDARAEDLYNRRIRARMLQTEARRVRYDNAFKEGSTINAEFAARRGTTDNIDALNDNFDDPYKLSGHRNMGVMTQESDGYFDPIATATGTNQGITRYLVESAVIKSDGAIEKGALDDRCPIMKDPVFRYSSCNPFDRNQMTFSNIMTSERVVKKVGTAQMTFGGWNFDDGYIVSADFAKTHRVMGANGEERDLAIHDKIMDMNGNKGVISIVVDRNDTEETLKARALANRSEAWWNKNKGAMLTAVAWFKANPGLDVVGAPYPAVSRFNGGSARELMENPQELKAPDMSVYESLTNDPELAKQLSTATVQLAPDNGCLGETTYIITHHMGDKKSLVYDEDAMREGRGRRASAQLAWGLAGNDCPKLLNELYATNDGAYVNFREYLITMGLDMSPTGELLTQYTPQSGETRNVFEIPSEIEFTEKGRPKSSMINQFDSLLSQNGGVMEIPFPLEMPSGGTTPPLNESKTDVISTEKEFEVAGYTRKDGVQVKPHMSRRAGTFEVTQTTYGLPVMSSALRSGTEMLDGSSTTHEYTNSYRQIYEQSLIYIGARNTYNDPNADATAKAAALKTMETAQRDAQTSYDTITEDVKNRVFEGKHNYYRDHLMSNRLSDSATQVWSADPTLELDEIGMPETTMKKLHIKEGDWVLTWRDPVISTGGVRLLKATRNNELTGVSINPVIDKSYEGDFDGDSIGLYRIKSKEALQEAIDKLTQQANLIDYESKTSTTQVDYALSTQDALDIKTAKALRPELANVYEDLVKAANAVEADMRENGIDDGIRARRQDILEQESKFMREAFAGEFGGAVISFKDAQSHLESIFDYVQQGAKGKPSKMKDYAEQAGFKFEFAYEGGSKTPTGIAKGAELLPGSLKGRKDDEGVEYATDVKAFGTGIAGMYPQRGMAACRNIAAEAVLGLTHPVTQANLQIKHNVEMANVIYPMLQGPVRELWRGHILEQTKDGNWTAKKDKDGKPAQASTYEWEENLSQIYDKVLDCPVNPDYVHEIAMACSEKGVMKNIEEMARTESAAMDIGAYSDCSFEATLRMAKEGRSIAEGKYNREMLSSTMRHNLSLAEAGRPELMKPLCPSDSMRIQDPKKSKIATSVHIKTEEEKAAEHEARASRGKFSTMSVPASTGKVDVTKDTATISQTKVRRDTPDQLKTGMSQPDGASASKDAQY